MSYDCTPHRPQTHARIEGSPDHWWVTTCHSHLWWVQEIEGSPDHWWVTTSTKAIRSSSIYWRVTRSLVSYDFKEEAINVGTILKGHQIIGELRPNCLPDSLHSLYWRVTRSLVSYDKDAINIFSPIIGLKGHQIIGELRHDYQNNSDHCFNWRVTRSLVSYDSNNTHNSICVSYWRVTRSLVSYDSRT